jgi:hypothetical protein
VRDLSAAADKWVTRQMATLLDWGNVEAACAQVDRSLALADRRAAFTLLCLATKLRIDFDEARGCVTDGSSDRGIDAVYLDERFGRRVIHLFQIKCNDNFGRAKNHFPSSELDKIISFISDCFAQVDGFLESCNLLLRQKVIDIWAFAEGGTCEVEIHLCSNGARLIADQRARFEASLARFKFIKANEVDLDSLSSDLSRRSWSEREINLRIVEEQIFERTDGSARAVIGTVRADELISALTDPSTPTQLDPYLFEENVRVYLGEQNDINRRIFYTAVSSDAGLFWYFNNGITIVCERVSFNPGLKNAPLRLKNPQVVNGGQTSHALFQASKANAESFSRIRLLVRIIETQEKEFYAKVAEATNSQTPIRSRDLRSNDPNLLRLETSLRAHGYYLDRKRDQHATIPERYRIDALKLGQMWLAYVRGEPEKAKTASDRIFGEYFPLIFDPQELDAQRALAVWRLYEALEAVRRREIENSRHLTRRRASQIQESSWVVEGLYHFAYAVKKIADEKNINIFDLHRVLPLIDLAAERLADFVAERPRVSFYRLFRSAATKQGIFDSSSPEPQLSLDLEP